MTSTGVMPGSQSPIVLREQLRKLEIEYARRRFDFELCWANNTKKYGPKTLKELIRMTNNKIAALKYKENHRWRTVRDIQRKVLIESGLYI